MKILQLKKDSERRFKSGHPWVFSNEILDSLKGLTAGDVVEMRDAAGQFLSRGYINPNSLIAFRSLTRDPAVNGIWSDEWLTQHLVNYSFALRERMGLSKTSTRLCFGEADGIPGLIVDRYWLTENKGQVWVIQAHTAGIQLALPRILDFFKGYLKSEKIALVVRNDMSVRKFEGLTIEEPKIVENRLSQVDISQARFDVSGCEFQADLLNGQKTGFFLDQTANAIRMSRMVSELFSGRQTVRILDLFCYVGQWGSFLTQALRVAGVKNVQVTAMDASAEALQHAKVNLHHQGAQVETVKADILEKILEIPNQSYDLVVCDPPALIKSKKDFAVGKQAYVKLNTESMRILKKPGVLISSSCSAHLAETDFVEVLTKASYRSKVRARWVDRGGHGLDHPVVAEFPEGKYLKTWLGWVV